MRLSTLFQIGLQAFNYLKLDAVRCGCVSGASWVRCEALHTIPDWLPGLYPNLGHRFAYWVFLSFSGKEPFHRTFAQLARQVHWRESLWGLQGLEFSGAIRV